MKCDKCKVDKALKRGQDRMDRLTEDYARRMAKAFTRANEVLASAGCVCVVKGDCNCPTGAAPEQWAKMRLMDEAQLRAIHLPSDHLCMSQKCWKAPGDAGPGDVSYTAGEPHCPVDSVYQCVLCERRGKP